MAEIGTTRVTIAIRIGDGEAFDVGEFDLPISGRASLKYGEASIHIDGAALRTALADALEDAARQLRKYDA